MSDFSDFLAENKVKSENIKYVASKSFIDKATGKPKEWELKTISNTLNEDLQKQCQRRVPLAGKSGRFQVQIDENKYQALLVTSCVVYPDLNNKALQDSYGVMGAAELVKAMLNVGEYADLAKQCLSINGFDVGLDELVEEAKN